MSTRRAASPAAGEQVSRILTLVPFLHARGQVNVDEAAALLDVSPAQVVSDLKVLFMCGLPGGYPGDLIDVDIDALEGEGADGVIRVANADYLARPLRLTPTEASAMIVAVRALRGGAGEETRPIVDRVLGKLEAAASSAIDTPLAEPGDLAFPPGVGSASGLGGPAAETPETTALAARLHEAAEAGRQVRLRYWVPARDEVSERVVDPRGVTSREGRTYLDAFCHSAEAPRLFRLDRVDDATVLDTPVSSPREKPRDLSQGGLLDSGDEMVRVTLRLHPEARWVADYYPVERVRRSETGPLGTVLVDLPVADERWLTRLVLRLAPHAEVAGPAAYVAGPMRAAVEALALYDQPTTPVRG